MGLQSFRDSIAAAIDQRLSHADAVAESITAAAKAQFLKTLPEAIAKAAAAHKPKTVLGIPAHYLPLAALGLALAGAGVGGWTAFEIGKSVGAAVARERCAGDQKPPPAPPAAAPKKTGRPWRRASGAAGASANGRPARPPCRRTRQAWRVGGERPGF